MTPMLAPLLALSLVVGPTDVEKADKLYEKARYEKALKALGGKCSTSSDAVACERLRAFILVALGRNDEALGAFCRMLSVNSDASLGPDVSPRLQRMFADAKRGVLGVRGMELEPIDVTDAGGPWGLRSYAPDEQPLKKVVVYLAPPGLESFQAVELRSEEDLWVGEVAVADGEAGTGRYYLEATLPSGVAVNVGSESEPLDVDVRLLAALPGLGDGNGNGNGKGDGDGDGDGQPFGMPGVGDDGSGGGLPTWAVWTIVGGVAVVAAVGVTLAVVLSRDSQPGTIVVNIGFSDDP